MQLQFSPSMRSITISSNNGFIDLMKIKVAACHISYRTLFHTILILAFLLPFVFILTAVVTLEGVNKCSSFGTSFIFYFIAFSIQFFLLCIILFCYVFCFFFFGYVVWIWIVFGLACFFLFVSFKVDLDLNWSLNLD